ncbi:MAG TPA: YicC/YloC family endoribonuclease [bacterium]|nr:YicC/YloC family endoribonuclease [bacterium]
MRRKIASERVRTSKKEIRRAMPDFLTVARSMTGFGAGEIIAGAGRYGVEVRSVNHRFCEVVVRTPRDLSQLEDRIRALVQSRVLRGRVDVVVVRDDYGRRPRTVKTDTELAKAYISALDGLRQALPVSGTVDLSLLLSLPDLVKIEDEKADVEAAWPAVESGVGAALEKLVAMREAEGARLSADLLARLARMEGVAEAIAARAPAVVEDYHARLERRVQELAGSVAVDPGRLATEVALFADRSDITEELTRFRSHLAQSRTTLAGPGAIGRTLEFIVQEIGREANTIGSKANDLEITRHVIAIKGELESLREQIQNVE